MEKSELIKHWKNTSELDYVTFKNLFNSGDYNWALFMGHLVLEKLLKALIVQNNTDNISIPKSHDLLLLAEKAHLTVDEQKADLLDMATAFNINARYPDYKQSFYKKCTLNYTKERIKEIEELREWLNSSIKIK